MIEQSLNKYKSHYTGKYPHKYKAYNLNLQENLELKTRLLIDGFFAFHTTNNGLIVYCHQIVAYYHCGGIHALKRDLVCKKDEYEIHHINGNTFDNNPNNLVYLPKVIHQEITINQRRLIKYLKLFGKKSFNRNFKNIIIWNKQGRTVKSILDFIAYWLEQTLWKTAHSLSIPLNLKVIGTWRRLVRKALKAVIPTYWQNASWLIVT